MSTPFDHIPSCSRTADYTKPTATAPVSRLEEVEQTIKSILHCAENFRVESDALQHLARALAAECVELQRRLDAVVGKVNETVSLEDECSCILPLTIIAIAEGHTV